MFAKNSLTHAERAARFFEKRRNVALNAIGYTFLWGCAFPLVKICMESFAIGGEEQAAKCLLAGIRFTAAGALTLLLYAFAGEDSVKPGRKQLRCAILYGMVATALQYSFTYIGLSRIDGSRAAVYDQLWVFVVVLTGGLFYRSERLTRRKLIGCVLGFLGVLVISTDGGAWQFHPAGEGFMLMAAACQTAANLLAKRFSGILPAAKLTGYGQLIGGAALTLVSLLAGGRITVVSLRALAALLLLIFISSAAYTMSLMPLRYCPVTEVSSWSLLITVFGILMSALMLGENILRAEYAAAILLIGGGIHLINGGKHYVESI